MLCPSSLIQAHNTKSETDKNLICSRKKIETVKKKKRKKISIKKNFIFFILSALDYVPLTIIYPFNFYGSRNGVPNF